MKSRLLVVALVPFLIAGCLDDEEGPALDPEGVAEEDPYTPLPPLPEDIHETYEITAGFDIPLPVGDEEFCWMPTHACIEEPFTIPDAAPNITITIDLHWTHDHNNLGVFLYEGDTDLAWDSGPSTTGTSVGFTYTFTQGGDYRIVIDPHWAAADTATLEATFTWADGQ